MGNALQTGLPNSASILSKAPYLVLFVAEVLHALCTFHPWVPHHKVTHIVLLYFDSSLQHWVMDLEHALHVARERQARYAAHIRHVEYVEHVEHVGRVHM